MSWTVAGARKRFSKLLKEAARQPQVITHRNRPVAVVIDEETFRQFEGWRRQRERSLFDAFADLRKICEEEDYRLVTPERSNRPDAFAE